MLGNLAVVFKEVDWKNFVLVVESNDVVIFEAVLGNAMVVGVGVE